MKQVIDIITQLEQTPGKNDKLAILQANKANEELKQFFFLCLDPFTRFYIRKIPSHFPAKKAEMDLATAMASLDELSSRKYTGNAAKEYLARLLHVSGEHSGLIQRIIRKDPDCGVQGSTVNKVWPGLIFECEVMLASAYDQKLVDKISFPAIVQLKADGMRFNAIVRDGETVQYLTRSGKELDLLDGQSNPAAEFLALAKKLGMKDVVFDGELLVRHPATGEYMSRKEGNGILNKANKGTIDHTEASLVCAMLWDVIDYNAFMQGFDKTPYSRRIEQLQEEVRGFYRISVIPTSWVANMEEATHLFNAYLADGYEGIILKDRNMPWEAKRSKLQIKFKAEKECDLVCVGWNEGSKGTKYEGLLGALACETADGKLKVNVGGGLTDNLRKTLKPKDVVGKIVTVLYNEKIKDASGNWSLFLPRFVEIRIDKDEADTHNNIK